MLLRNARLQIFVAWAQENVRFLCWIIVFVTFGPIVANSICEYLAVGIETALCDGLFHRFRRFQFRASIFVPETKCAVGTNCC